MRIFKSMLLSSSLLFGFHFSVFASPVSKERIDLVNTYMEKYGKKEMRIQFLSAEEDETGTIFKIEFEMSQPDWNPKKGTKELSKGRISTSLQDDVAVNADLDFYFPINPSGIPHLIKLLESIKDLHNKQGDYEFAFSSNDEDQKTLKMNVNVKSKATQGVFLRKMDASSVSNIPIERHRILIDATLHTNEDSMDAGRDALTKVFSALANGKEPEKADREEVSKLFEFVRGNIMGIFLN